MRHGELVNAGAIALALATSVLLAARPAEPTDASGTVVDATGARLTLRGYRRIASASTVADRLLIELCEADRVIAFTAASAAGADAHRYAGRARVDRLDDVERILALAPDLVLVHNVADPRRVQRLRDAGLTVFDLGPLEGVRSLPDDVRRVAALCGAPERAEPYVTAFTRRLAAIARHVPEERRRSAMYLALYGGQLFGGTRGSTYHDVLSAAGLRDRAADTYEGWPQYSPEQIIALDPELIVTRSGMGRQICARAGLARLSACPDHVLELDGAMLDAPGPGILDAAEAVHAAAYE